jgi:DUF971 family protein
VTDSPYPVEVRRLREQERLRLSWSDEHVGEYAHAYLRGWCPCAACQGHGGGRRFIEAANNDLEAIEVVGNYALQFRWADGHESGIYSYQYLRDLCPCEKCKDGGGD